MSFPHRHLLGIEPLAASEIQTILDTADALREILDRPIKKVPGAARQDGGQPVLRSLDPHALVVRDRRARAVGRQPLDRAAASSVTKGETLLDTARNLEAMNPDMVIVRHASSGAPHLLASHCRFSVVNAGDGAHEHPTQALLDALTIRQKKGRLSGLSVAIVGDILHSRVARSNLWLLSKLGAKATIAGPPTLVPPGLEGLARVTHSIDEAVEGADVIMMLRIQLERMSGGFFPTTREYHKRYGLTEERVRRAKKDVLVMHPGPMNRGRRDRERGGRRPVLGDPRAGHERRRRCGWPCSTCCSAAARRPRREPAAGRRGRVVDPSQELDAKLDVLLKDGVVERLGEGLRVRDAERVDAKGLVVCPGFIDLHTHLREPGREDKETIATGTRAAAAGGFTAVCAMPNTNPVNDSAGITRSILEKARAEGVVRVYPIGAITRGQQGAELAEYGDLQEAGCVAVSDDGKPVASARVMRRALEYARGFGLVVIDTARSRRSPSTACMNEGPVATRLGLRGAPTAGEAIMVERDVLLAELTGGRVHIAHLSAAASVDAVRPGQGARCAR
jgi:aspartate carbamoyltransferase catalytic subunit